MTDHYRDVASRFVRDLGPGANWTESLAALLEETAKHAVNAAGLDRILPPSNRETGCLQCNAGCPECLVVVP